MTTATILVVDDSPTLVLSVSTMLDGAGFDVETAMNGQEALDRLHAGLRPSLILTDVNMPVMDGLGLIREVRKYDPTRFTPILVLTNETHLEAETRDAGASGWLAKPPERGVLLAVVDRLLPT